MPSANVPPPASERLQSLDAYRGLIMFTLMCGAIFESLKGHPVWNWLAVQNEHVAWEGCVYWDLIQPSFIFMVGVAMPFAFASRAAKGESHAQQFKHVLIRALKLTLLGIVLDNFGGKQFWIGFMRVLQQIAFGYVIAFWFVGRSFRTQGIATALILVGYTCLWIFNPWNGPDGPWHMGNENIGSVFDRWLIGKNYNNYYVWTNAIPSTATMLFGVMAGQLIRNTTDRRRTSVILLAAGIAGVLLGLGLSPWIPIIKRLWTMSFTLFAGGCTTLMLLAFYWVIDVRGWKRWSFPLVVVGMNSIAAYVIENTCGGYFRSLSGAWLKWLSEPLGPVWFPVFQQALFALAGWGVLYWFYRRKIFFKL